MNKPVDLTWRSYEFSKRVVLFINKHEFHKNAAPIVLQLLRSSTSICANIVEGRSGSSRRILTNFYSIALRSANETKYWLCLVRDTISVDCAEIKWLIAEVKELAKILGKCIVMLKKP